MPLDTAPQSPALGSVRVNSVEYDGQIVVEQFTYWQCPEPTWAVPAWDERGEDLDGPFASIDDAERAIRAAGWQPLPAVR